MELFLNLAWLMLVVPAYWIWQSARSRQRGEWRSLQCLLALGCVLVLLFPVISATDDLHAMRAEMEESGTNKRSVRQAVSDASVWNNRTQTLPAVLGTVLSFAFCPEYCERPLTLSSSFVTAPYAVRAGRAPPVSRLS
jgi:predicted MFS family arabinose efflux permease